MRQLTQSIEKQNAVLAQAEERGEMQSLAWFVEVYAADKRFRGADGKRYFCFEYPGHQIPTVPIVGDGVASRVAIELLVMLAEEANDGKRLEFYPALAWASEVAESPFYDYGAMAQPDVICVFCGGVTKRPIAGADAEPVPCSVCGADIG